MDLVHQAEQPGDIGICQQHSRVYQCYCTLCSCMICPSCLMFDSHKGHSVCKIEQGSKQLRNFINNSAKQGILKFQRTQNVLLDIRHAKLSLQQNQQMVIKQAQTNFDQLISIIKARKSKFINQINQHFNHQLQKIQDAEFDWIHKQQLSQKILLLQTSKDDVKLLDQSKQIVQGLKQLSKPLDYTELKLIQTIKCESNYTKNPLTFSQIKQILKNFMYIGTPTLNKLKC